jgi:hypothetical protein
MSQQSQHKLTIATTFTGAHVMLGCGSAFVVVNILGWGARTIGNAVQGLETTELFLVGP